MKKLYIIVTVMLLSLSSFGQTPIITGIMDGDCDQGRPKVLEIYADGTVDFSLYSLEKQVNAHTDWEGTYDMTPLGTITDSFIYLYDDHADFPGVFAANFPSASNTFDLSALSILEFNGDDRVRIINTSSGATVDQYGVTDVDGTGEDWEYKDGYGKRNSGTSANAGAFVSANWTINNGGFDGQGSCVSGTLFETIFGIGTFTPGSGTNPSLVITSPTEGATLNPEASVSMDVTFVVQNFDVANGTGDGHIHYTIDGGDTVMKYDTDPITITGLSSGAHNVYMELVDNSHNPLSPAVNTTVNFSIAAYTDVADLAALRAGTEGEYYRVTGEVIGTYAQNYRHQKWCQDATAGIKIDDNSEVITTVYNEGDGLVNLRGKLTSFHGLLQLVPTADPGKNSSGNTVTPVAVSLSVLAANVGDYESELVLITAATIADWDDGGSGDADGTFQTGKEYPLTDASTTGVLRTNFYDADYIGATLPAGSRDYTCIVASFDGNVNVTPRDGSDILGIQKLDAIKGFALYPNPVVNGTLHITTSSNLLKDIEIFNILGKQVLTNSTTKTSINVSSLQRGVYIIKVIEAGKTATRKLMIE
jgi:hypothetical protein